MYEPDAFVVPGFNPGMPAINRPPIGLTDQEILSVIAYLQSLGGTPTVTLQTSHRYYKAPAAPGAPPAPGEAPPPGAPADQQPGLASRCLSPRRQPRKRRQACNSGRPGAAPAPAAPGRGDAMNILVVLAVAVVFGLLRFRRASLLLWAVAWWVGIYVLLRFGFTTPIPASVISIYMGIVSLAILAYVSSSEAAP